MNDPEQDIVAHKVRRAVGLQALRRIGAIVEDEQRAEAQRKKALRWLMRYGWLILLAVAALLARAMGLI
ncbi:MAG: hypothetical protein HYZ46_06595 [Nitrosomonadales bacterium]|nr:hypothetical protein [Nitrosomonadales bacterium]